MSDQNAPERIVRVEAPVALGTGWIPDKWLDPRNARERGDESSMTKGHFPMVVTATLLASTKDLQNIGLSTDDAPPLPILWVRSKTGRCVLPGGKARKEDWKIQSKAITMGEVVRWLQNTTLPREVVEELRIEPEAARLLVASADSLMLRLYGFLAGGVVSVDTAWMLDILFGTKEGVAVLSKATAMTPEEHSLQLPDQAARRLEEVSGAIPPVVAHFLGRLVGLIRNPVFNLEYLADYVTFALLVTGGEPSESDIQEVQHAVYLSSDDVVTLVRFGKNSYYAIRLRRYTNFIGNYTARSLASGPVCKEGLHDQCIEVFVQRIDTGKVPGTLVLVPTEFRIVG